MGEVYAGKVHPDRQPLLVEAFLRKFGRRFRAQDPWPNEHVGPDMLRLLITHVPDNIPGLDGVAKGDLMLLSDLALDWLAKLFMAVEGGASWPQCSNVARIAFISKGEHDLDPKGFRGLSILSVCYRLWGVATLQRLQGWIASWETDSLFAGTSKPVGAEDAWCLFSAQLENDRLYGRCTTRGSADIPNFSTSSVGSCWSTCAASVASPLAPWPPTRPSTRLASIITPLRGGWGRRTGTPVGSLRAAT